MRFLLLMAFGSIFILQAPQLTPVDATDICPSSSFSFSTRFVTLFWKTPAKFPEPQKFNSTHTDFDLTCETYSASLHNGVFTLADTESIESLFHRLGEPDLYYSSFYEYPAIRAGFTSSRITIRLSVPNEVSVKGDLFSDVVIAARLNGGSLQPLLFERKVTPISYQPMDIVEIYSKATYSKSSIRIPRMTIDGTSKKITVYSTSPFPAK